MFLSSMLLKSSPALLLSCADPRKELFPQFLPSTKRPVPFRAKTQPELGAGGSAGHGRCEDLRAVEGSERAGRGPSKRGPQSLRGCLTPQNFPPSKVHTLTDTNNRSARARLWGGELSSLEAVPSRKHPFQNWPGSLVFLEKSGQEDNFTEENSVLMNASTRHYLL